MSTDDTQPNRTIRRWQLAAPWIGLIFTIAFAGLLLALLAADSYLGRRDVATTVGCLLAALVCWSVAIVILLHRNRASAWMPRTSFDRKTPAAIVFGGLAFVASGTIAVTTGKTAPGLVVPWIILAVSGLLLFAYGCYVLRLNRRYYRRRPRS